MNERTLNPDSLWARKLDRFQQQIALVLSDKTTISYAELMARADAFAARLGAERRLVVLGVRNDVASIAAYLGCLRHHHPVLLLAAGALDVRIVDNFQPDARWDATDDSLWLAERPIGELHPDLAVLLSTSGSTGSPKLVRLSAAAIAANAASICEYLSIDAQERAITTLPFHYSYGLSVLNSHLMAGASLALTDLSVTHPGFESFLLQARPTSIAGVPYTHELLLRSGLMQRLPDSVQMVTQAGGRLAPDLVLEIASIGLARGFRFCPMYGQTEATARMSYLPPELVESHPDCIGQAIPGGAFRLIDADGATIHGPGISGELVYQGPNVMMGYGLTRADLARGPELSELHTGDIAERTSSGLYKIVGRASRFAKIAGLRIGFDDLEALLRAEGVDAVVTGTDELIAIQLPDSAQEERLPALLNEKTGLPESVIAVIVGTVPRLANDKIDYHAIRAAGVAQLQTRETCISTGVHPILAGYRRAFNAPSLPDTESFQSFGGDSLAYVNVAIAIEKSLGELPSRWEEMPISALIALDDGKRLADEPRNRTTRIGVETLAGLWALMLVIIGHGAPDQTVFLRGGAGILMLLAGYNFARFQRHAFEHGHSWPALKGALERLILPYYLMMVPLLFFSEAQKSWGWFALVSTYTVDVRGPLFPFWFIEAVFHALLLMILIYAVPAMRQFSRTSPVVFGFVLLVFALGMKLVINRYVFDDFNAVSLTVDAQFWLYAAGFAALSLRQTGERLLLVGIVLMAALLDYGLFSSRGWWLLLVLLPLLFRPLVPVPSWLARPVLRLAAAGYFIYIVHVPLHHVVRFVFGLSDRPLLSITLLLLSSLIGGLVFEALWSRVMQSIKMWLAGMQHGKSTTG